ncbi:phosphotransferase [Celerinatantimonas sp. YJH-8]|uniref:phosphotransferase n=1 Tax=Celerinatantimonas sp. YJH-8 TaxID=3228714 RepID=UPI0038C4B4AE
MPEMPQDTPAQLFRLSLSGHRWLTQKTGPITQITPVYGGHHQLWLLQSANGPFIFRQPLAPALFGTNYQREDTILQALYHFPWAIHGQFIASSEPWLLYSYIDGTAVDRQWFQRHPEHWEQLLAILDSFPLISLPHAEYMYRPTHTYLAHYLSRATYAPSIAKALAQRWLEQFPISKRLVLNHHDLSPANLLIQNQQLVVLDWEYAALSDPGWDQATLANHFELNASQLQQLQQRSALSPQQFAYFRQAATLLDLCWYSQNPIDATLEQQWRRWQKGINLSK